MGPLIDGVFYNLTIKFVWFITMYSDGSQFAISVLDARNIFYLFSKTGKTKDTFHNHP